MATEFGSASIHTRTGATLRDECRHSVAKPHDGCVRRPQCWQTADDVTGNEMTNILGWLATHYLGTGEYFLSAAVALLIAILGTALPQLGLTSRWPRLMAACVGLILTALGVGLAVGKTVSRSPLRQIPWVGPETTGVVGLILIGTAWALETNDRKRTRQRLGPVVEAAWRGIERMSSDAHQTTESGMGLRTPAGRSVLREVMTTVRRRQSKPITLLTGPAGAGKTLALLSLAHICRSSWIERRSHILIPVYVDLAAFAHEPDTIPVRDFILKELGQDTGLIETIIEMWRDKKLNATWMFLCDHVDQIESRRRTDVERYDWFTDLTEFLAVSGRGSHAVLAGQKIPDNAVGTTVEVAPVSRRLREHLLSAQGVTDAQQAVLNSEKSFRQYIGNLAWLDLISGYLADHPGNEPSDCHSLMGAVVDFKLNPPQHAGKKTSTETLINIAQESAMILSEYTSPDSVMMEADLIKALEQNRHEASGAKTALRQLINTGLMTIQAARNGGESVRFQHDSIIGYFLTCQVMEMQVSSVDIRAILEDRNRPTVAISLLQHGASPLVDKMISEASAILGPLGEVPPTKPITIVNRFLRLAQITERASSGHDDRAPSWPSTAYEILHILDAGVRDIAGPRQCTSGR